jgi:transposase
MSTQRNRIDDSQRQKIIHAIFDDGLTTSEAARRFGYPRSTIYAIVKAFENEGRMEQKFRGGNRPKRLSQEHTKWLSDRLSARPDTAVAPLCQELNDHFNFDPPVSTASVSRAIRNQVGYTLKLLRHEPADYNSPERIRMRQAWTQEFLKSTENIGDVVFVHQADFNLHLVRRFARMPRGQRPVKILPMAKGKNLSMIVAAGKEGIIA